MIKSREVKMMKFLLLVVCSVSLTVAVSTTANALAAEHPEGTYLSIWPDGLTELMNGKERIYGYFVNFWDYFYFEGDTASLNAFLQKLGDISFSSFSPGLQPVVTIHPGKGKTRKLAKNETLEYDWSFSTRPEGSPIEDNKMQYGLAVDVWLGSDISLADLKVPASIEVRSGGEIEKFVQDHESARAATSDESHPD